MRKHVGEFDHIITRKIASKLILILMMKSGKELIMKHIEFNRKKLWELQVLYDEAISRRKEMFYFRNQLLFTNYAKHLLEYLNREVGTPKGKGGYLYNYK